MVDTVFQVNLLPLSVTLGVRARDNGCYQVPWCCEATTAALSVIWEKARLVLALEENTIPAEVLVVKKRQALAVGTADLHLVGLGESSAPGQRLNRY